MRHVINIGVQVIIVAGSICFALIPFDRSRHRASWAKVAFVTFGLVGTAAGLAGILITTSLVALEDPLWESVNRHLGAMRGFLLGLAFSIIASGQLLGSRSIPRRETKQ